MKISGVLKVETTNQLDTNGLQTPYSNTPPLMRSQKLGELDTQQNKHKWYAMIKPPRMDSGNKEVIMPLKTITIRTEQYIGCVV